MTISPLVLVHIWAALAGILFGWAALYSRKGSRLHRLSGTVFFISMLGMSSSAAYVAAFVKPDMTNVVMGVFVFYLVATAWLTIRRKDGEIGLLEFALLAVALADGTAGLIFGREAMNSATGLKDGHSATGYFVLGSLVLLYAASDVRMLIRGGVSGAQRIARHLWRMCFALLIATASLFLGQPRLFPEPIRASKLLFVPVIAVIVSMIYWLIRVRFSGAYKKARKISVAGGAGTLSALNSDISERAHASAR
jgi:uncharacterized membrane protein